MHICALWITRGVLEYLLLWFFGPGAAMAFPLPKLQAPQLPQHLLRTIECQQGAVRAVRFNGKTESSSAVMFFEDNCGLNVIFFPAFVQSFFRSADGNYLLSCGSDKSLKLWSVGSGTLLKTYAGHGYDVLDADGWVLWTIHFQQDVIVFICKCRIRIGVDFLMETCRNLFRKKKIYILMVCRQKS